MKRFGLLAILAILLFGVLTNVSLAAPTKAQAIAAVKAQFPDRNLQKFDFTSGWKREISTFWEGNVKYKYTWDKIGVKITSGKNADGVYEVHEGMILYKNGVYDQFKGSKSTTYGLKQMSKAQLIEMALDAIGRVEPHTLDRNMFLSMWTDILYIKEIKLATPDNVRFVSADRISVDLEATYGILMGNVLKNQRGIISAIFNKKNGVWTYDDFFSRALSPVLISQEELPIDKYKLFKNMETSGFKGIYGLSEPTLP